MKKMIVFVLFAFVLLVSCNLSNQTGSHLEIEFNASSMKNRTIVPDLDMSVSAYTVAGENSEGDSFMENGITGSSVVIDSLTPGVWQITVQALNSTGTVIGVGFASGVEIVEGETTHLSINVEPAAGEGTLELSVTWSDFSSGTPVVTGYVVNGAGENISLDMTEGTDSAFYNGFLPAGYYDLFVQAVEGSGAAYFYSAIRIIAGQTTVAEILLKASGSEGSLSMEIVTDLQNPVQIAFSGVRNPLPLGSTMTVTASTDRPVDSYQWILNNTVLIYESQPVITLGSNLAIGSYSLTLRVTDGPVISSETVVFEVAASVADRSVIMIYLDGDNNLEGAAIDDINEMEAVNLEASGVRIIVLFDRIDGFDSSNGDWTGTRLYEVAYDANGYDGTIVSRRIAGMGLDSVVDSELNMGDPGNLAAFVDFCMTAYPADDYSLVLWNHGGGWRNRAPQQDVKAVAWDDTNGGDCLYTSEIQSALAGKGLGLIGFDACLMQMAEVMYEMRTVAGIMVGAEETEPWDGWDYVGLLNSYLATDLSLASLSRSIVDSYGLFYGYSWTCLSAVNLSYIGQFASAVDAFSSDLMALDATVIRDARTAAQSFYYSDYIDLYDFAAQFAFYSADQLRSVISNMVIASWCYSGMRGYGVSIYLPNVSLSPAYLTEIDFSADTLWDEFLVYLTSSPMEPDAYEPDNDISHATAAALNSPQLHSFHQVGDQDFLTFTAAAGDTLTFETRDTGSNTDTYLVLFGSNGTTVLAEDDDSGAGYYSLLSYTFTESGSFFIMVRPYCNSTAYVGHEYEVLITNGATMARDKSRK